jgi:hypothetical protein
MTNGHRFHSLLDEQFAPITSSMGFLRAPISKVAEGLEQWLRRLGSNPRVDRPTVRFPEVLLSLQPLVYGGRTRQLLLSAGTSWTAYFDNGAAGPDPVGPVSYLAGVLACQGVTITTVPHTVGHSATSAGRMGSIQFAMYGPERTSFLNYIRTVGVSFEGKWEFDAIGEVQPFERTDAYSARRIRDRFDTEMLKDYCLALGLSVFDPFFFGPDAVLIEHDERRGAGVLPPITLPEAQARLGIRPRDIGSSS